jgi:CspA family cold shock protein
MGAKFTGEGEEAAGLSEETVSASRNDALSSGEPGADATIEVSGAIKWFDAGKGFGFIVPDNGMADVLLHVTCLRRYG